MNLLEKQHRIYETAEEDPVYRIWRDQYLRYRKDFAAYADAQPQEVQDMLWGYAAGGQLMNQRLLNIACRDMEFENHEPNEAK